ncbi:ATP-binding cassette domain-containing protein, partial [Achromobacter insolitus]
MLDVNAIDQYYGGSHTLRGVSLALRQGECLALLGRNGVGKTTLLKCVMGVLPVARGHIAFDGADVTRLAPHQR